MEGIFITGTDTDVGKTTICAGLLKLLHGHKPVRYWKPIQTGTVVSDDTNDLKQMTELSAQHFIEPVYRFPEPVSPHFAARKWGKTIEIRTILEARDAEAVASSFTVVEGAGGLYVPLSEKELLIDLIQAMAMPLILVTEDRVGAINQTLLSLKAARSSNLQILGVILTKSRGGFGNKEAIEHFGKVEVLGEFHPSDDAKTTVAQVSSSPRLRELFGIPPLP